MTPKEFYNELTWISEGRDGDHISFREDILKGAIEKLLSSPPHETVEQWENRTGNNYPDDGPVWLIVESTEWLTGWRLTTKRDWINYYNYEMTVVYVANHHGKPKP